MRKFKLNNKLLMAAVIASLVVEQAPNLINNLVFKDNPQSGLIASGMGAGAGILTGIVLKKPEIGTLSIALAASDYLNSMLSSTLGLMGGSTVKDFLSVDSAGNPQFALADYTNSPEIMPTSEYEKSYAALN